ncbi:hypothetical protein CRYUN_Cryun18bG0045900 [Craigia yunnanensis]
MVVRNATSTICLISAVMKIENVDSPLQAELKAVAFGLEIAKENSFPSILVESDSLIAIQERVSFQILLMSLEFGQCSFKHINRSANECTHNVAKLSCDLDNYIVWRNSKLPLFVILTLRWNE